jgi:AcrR family transcriptional regulator
VVEMNKKDLRVIKTKNMLYTTLISLMREKRFEEIKVSDICSQALINRSTFYSHYNDKYELLADYINDLKKSLLLELEKNKNTLNTKEYYLEMIKLFLNHIDEKREIYLSTVINNHNSIMMDIVYDVLVHDISSDLKKEENNQIPRDIIAKFYLGAVVSVGIEWLKNGKQYTKEELLEYFDVLIPNELNYKR